MNLSQDLLECFDYNHGALPEICLRGISTPSARAVLTALLQVDTPPRDPQSLATELARFDEVHSGAAECSHHILAHPVYSSTPMPDLTVWVYPDEVSVQYLGGHEWSDPEIRALLVLINTLRAMAPESRLDYVSMSSETAFTAALNAAAAATRPPT